VSKYHPFRFGVINEHMTTREAWLAGARRAEALGYATFLIRDHFVPDFFGDQFAPFAALMAAAMVTTTLRIGTLVIDNDYRHPVMLAKEAATLDLLSDGRFELGLGAGWLRAEYAKAGMRYDAPGERISRLAESVRVLKGLWGCEPLTYTGKHYQIDSLNGFPKPAQQPHLPLLIGGGHQRMLTFAGREADSVGILTSSVASGTLLSDPLERLPESVAQKVEWVRQGAGERFDQVELSLVPDIIFAEDREQAAADYLRRKGWQGISATQVLSMPSVFIGSAEQMAEAMWTRREQFGFSYYVMADDQMEETAPVVAMVTGQ
jgi:probable F420-dependent oxidoreductase